MRPTLTENSYIAPRCIDCYISGCGGTASCDAFGCQSRIRIENLLRHVVIIVQCYFKRQAREEIPCGGIVFHRSGNGTVADSNIYVQRRYIGSFWFSILFSPGCSGVSGCPGLNGSSSPPPQAAIDRTVSSNKGINNNFFIFIFIGIYNDCFCRNALH